jgi:hypothetical protein
MLEFQKLSIMLHGELVQALDSAHITRIRNTQYTHEMFDVFDKEGRKEGKKGCWLPTSVGLKSQQPGR